jgi:carbonic anhydrase
MKTNVDPYEPYVARFAACQMTLPSVAGTDACDNPLKTKFWITTPGMADVLQRHRYEPSIMKPIIDGFLQFKKEVFPQKRKLFRDLASGQKPIALFITCADSRVVPDLITQSQPGDLFICRTVGNQVPPHGAATEGGVASTIEYAVQVLGVPDIIVCGHSDCGAMKAALRPEKMAALPATRAWLRNADAARAVVHENYPEVAEEVLLHLLTEENIIAQLEHVKTHPAVAPRVTRGELNLHGWLYHIHSGEITTFDSRTGRFVPLDHNTANATPTPRIRAFASEGAA